MALQSLPPMARKERNAGHREEEYFLAYVLLSMEIKRKGKSVSWGLLPMCAENNRILLLAQGKEL